MFRYLHHISITCVNLSRMVYFYQKIGFKKERDYQDEEIIILWLKRDDFLLEFLHYLNVESCHQSRQPETPTVEHTGITHFAVNEPDLVQYRINLINDGISCGSIKSARIGLFSYFFVVDPDGNKIEFIGDAG